MKKIAVVTLLLLLVLGGSSFAQGIKFEHQTLEEALSKAKQDNKLVFVDFHTVWCAPCRAMEKSVFPDAKVGEFYNKNFINIELDAEKEGLEAAKKYDVHAYPTLMFIDGDGGMVYKKVGGINAESTINLGKDALKSSGSKYSLVRLKELFPQKQNDQDFLKTYFEKMIEYGENPSEGIEAWLKVQTEIKENDVDMMEFLMKYRSYLIVGGKAEEVFNANFNEYMDIATRSEELVLKHMRVEMVNNTRTAAYGEKSPELMQLFINNWKRLPEAEKEDGDLTGFKMDYLLLSKDYDAYKKLASTYLDSIVNAKPLEEIRTDDKAYYENFKKTKYTPSLIGDYTLKNLKKGREALQQTKEIERTCIYYLAHSDSKKDYTQLISWIDYGSKLVPENYNMDNLRSAVLYKEGKTKEAIEFKKSALEKLPQTDKHRPTVQSELEKMQKGEKL